MNALFEEAGKIQAARVMSQAQASVQLELDSGKRIKVKSSHVFLEFEKPQPLELVSQAQNLAAEVDLNLAWEFAPEDEFGFVDLAQDYFSANPSTVERAAMLLALHEAPHYFRRAGKGRFKKASAEVIQQALAAIEKKKQLQAQMDAWTEALVQGHCPAAIRQQLFKILFKPDKNAPEYKAVAQAAKLAQLPVLTLLQNAKAIDSAYQFHWQRFLFEFFPKGVAFPSGLAAPAIADDLPLANVQAYSIDDSETTEIDDALSVSGLGTGCVVLGIHIAAPALALSPGQMLDQVARQRLSTVYMPGYKITMLPDDVVQAYTLQEGRACPAVSLYARFDENTLELLSTESRVEKVFIAANLRHDRLDGLVTAEWLDSINTPDFEIKNAIHNLPVEPGVLSFLYRLALHLKANRERVRGKPETFSRPDYSFRLVGNDAGEPTGDENVHISVRKRGAPLDLMVAETMILANSTWGQWLTQLGVPAIYRSQASLAPGIKVRMGTKALPHAGIGVPSYAWSTSPLRRYTDLVNQWQIVACVRHGSTAALVAPFKPKDAQLLSIISAFDAAYAAYNQHQSSMERYWTLRHVEQNEIRELQASVIKAYPGTPAVVRAEHLPLVMSMTGGGDLPRGTQVLVRLGQVDLIALDVSATFVDVVSTGARSSQALDEALDEADDVAGPLKLDLALDEGEADANGAPNSGEANAN